MTAVPPASAPAAPLASTNVAVLVLRREAVDRAHFRTPSALPWLAVASCLLLLVQQSAGTWARAGLMLAAGALLFLMAGVRDDIDHAVK